MTRNGAQPTFADVSTFLTANPDWPYARRLRRRAEESMPAGLSDDTVRAWFKRFPPLTTAGRIRFAEAALAAGEEESGPELLRQAWVEGTFDRSQQGAFLAKHRKHLTRQDHVRRLGRLLWDGRVSEARRMSRLVDKGHRALADARIRLRQMKGNVDGAIARVPEDLRHDPGLIYERLRWRRRKERDQAARNWLMAHARDDVRPALWWRERAILARRALNEGHISEAYRIAGLHGLDEGLGFAEGEWLAGWIALRFLGDEEVAFRHFERMFNGVRYSISRARSAYWAGRSAQAMNEPEKADLWYRAAAQYATTYYGQLAAARLAPEDDLVPPPDPQPNADEVKAFEKHELARVVRQLTELDQQKRLKPFLKRLADSRDSGGWRVLTADLAEQSGRLDVAVGIARSAGRHGRPMLDVGYPTIRLPPLKQQTAGNLDDALVLAVIRQESGFKPTAKSSAGARGLLQLLPGTAKQVAKSLRMPYSKRRLTADESYNLTLGQAHLASLLKRYDGSLVLTLSAYNAGPGRVRTWLRVNGDPREDDVDEIDWVEMIPFAETRNYVQRVLENLHVYRWKLNRTRLAANVQ